MINLLIIVIIILFAIGLYCKNHEKIKSDYMGLINNGVEKFNDYGVKNIESFLDYSTVDRKKYPPIKKNNCPRMNGDLHISHYQRDPPEENSWVFGYPNYRNYLGGSSAIN